MIIPDNSPCKDLQIETTASRDGYQTRVGSEKWNRYVDSGVCPTVNESLRECILMLFETWCEPGGMQE